MTSTFEATADGILAVDLDNKISTFNKKFVEMWRIPKNVAEEKNTAQVIAWVSKQVKDSENFKNMIQECESVVENEQIESDCEFSPTV